MVVTNKERGTGKGEWPREGEREREREREAGCLNKEGDGFGGRRETQWCNHGNNSHQCLLGSTASPSCHPCVCVCVCACVCVCVCVHLCFYIFKATNGIKGMKNLKGQFLMLNYLFFIKVHRSLFCCV